MINFRGIVDYQSEFTVFAMFQIDFNTEMGSAKRNKKPEVM